MKIEKNNLDINLRVLKADHFDPGFAITFCDMVVPKLQQFKMDYKEYLLNKKLESLRLIVHELIATLRFLNLEEVCTELNGYLLIDLDNNAEVDELTSAIYQRCEQLEEALTSFKAKELQF